MWRKKPPTWRNSLNVLYLPEQACKVDILSVVDRCPVCTVEPGRIWLETKHAVALSAAQPLVDGHTVVVPRKHVGTIYELTTLEQDAIWELVGQVCDRMLISLEPAGFSIGFSDTMEDGDVGGHVCVHVVPRRRGDKAQLPNGIEWVTDDHVAEWKM